MSNINELQRLFRTHSFEGGAVLVLGAGVNGNVPHWDEMLQKLLIRTLNELGTSSSHKQCERQAVLLQEKFDSYAQASLVEACLGSDRLLSCLAAIIYRKSEFVMKKRGLIQSVAHLCESQSIRAVVTFNYDDYLEQVLTDSYPKRRFIAIDCLTADNPRRMHSVEDGGSLPIYHVHGFIPNPGRTMHHLKSGVVLSQATYLSLFGQNDNTANITPLHLLRSYQAVFIGCSLRDWNMIRLLQRSVRSGEQPHYCLSRRFGEEEGLTEENAYLLDQLRARLWETLGIKPVYFPNFGQIAKCVEQLAAVAPPTRKSASKSK